LSLNGISQSADSGTKASRIVLSAAVAILMVALVASPMGLSSGGKAPTQQEYVIAAAGDPTGRHLPMNNPYRHQYDDVADLIECMDPDRFLMLGDGQHENGLLEDYLEYYDSEFGKLLDITCPVPGNHDYYWDWEQFQLHDHPFAGSNGSGYFGYFGDLAYPPFGFYSFELGNWHLIALNSDLVFNYDYMEPGTPAYVQYEWLKDDLKAHPNNRYSGTIVFFHHPLYSWEVPSSPTWSSPELVPIWELMYASGVDIVLNGHSHNYQRWEPQDAYGNYQPDGIREFIVGTGGYYLNPIGHPPQPDNFVWGQADIFGALKLTLLEDSYRFEFVSIDGVVLDSGSFDCN